MFGMCPMRGSALPYHPGNVCIRSAQRPITPHTVKVTSQCGPFSTRGPSPCITRGGPGPATFGTSGFGVFGASNSSLPYLHGSGMLTHSIAHSAPNAPTAHRAPGASSPHNVSVHGASGVSGPSGGPAASGVSGGSEQGHGQGVTPICTASAAVLASVASASTAEMSRLPLPRIRTIMRSSPGTQFAIHLHLYFCYLRPHHLCLYIFFFKTF